MKQLFSLLLSADVRSELADTQVDPKWIGWKGRKQRVHLRIRHLLVSSLLMALPRITWKYILRHVVISLNVATYVSYLIFYPYSTINEVGKFKRTTVVVFCYFRKPTQNLALELIIPVTLTRSHQLTDATAEKKNWRCLFWYSHSC